MCGRYLLPSPVEALRQLFMFEQRPNLMPRYNVAPTQDVPIVRLTRNGEGRELIMVRWGLVPFWADDLSIGNRMINARCETVHSARAFREAYARRRCLVPAGGFFEWQKQGKVRQPFLIRRKDRVPFAFAGLWERWKNRSDGTVVRSCTIITCPTEQLPWSSPVSNSPTVSQSRRHQLTAPPDRHHPQFPGHSSLAVPRTTRRGPEAANIDSHWSPRK